MVFGLGSVLSLGAEVLGGVLGIENGTYPRFEFPDTGGSRGR